MVFMKFDIINFPFRGKLIFMCFLFGEKEKGVRSGGNDEKTCESGMEGREIAYKRWKTADKRKTG